MKWITLIAMVFSFTACRNAPVELISSLLQEGSQITAPNISSSNSGSSFVYVRSTPITPISFLNSGGPISLCEPVTPLPAGLSVNSANCQITGTPTTIVAANKYTLRASNSAGISLSATIAIVVYGPVATVDFVTAAGPGSAGLGGNPKLTFIDAMIGGAGIVSFKYKFLDSSTDCANSLALPSDEIPTSIRLTHDFSTVLDGNSVTLCVAGKDSNGVWQAWSGVNPINWVKDVPLQRLVDLPAATKNIIMHDLVTSSVVTSREFSLDGLPVGVDIGSSSSCPFKINSGAYVTGATVSDPANSKIRFEVTAAATSGTSTTCAYTIGGISYTLFARNRPLAITGTKKIFLSKKATSGAMNGFSGANSICQAEAEKYTGLRSSVWKALLTSPTQSGLAQVPTPGDYNEVNSNRTIISNRGFADAFPRFVDGSLTNGGLEPEWRFIVNAPRSGEPSKFWYGSTNCNCNSWSSTSKPSSTACTTEEVGGILAHESAAVLDQPAILNYLPPSSPSGGGQPIGYCNQLRHLVCYEQ